jgi:hypothetical protein
MEVKCFSLLALGLCSAYAGVAVAIEPASVGVGVGEMTLKPQIMVQLGHNDNIFSTQADQQATSILVINPSVQLVAEKANRAFLLNYDLKQGILFSSTADNYTDHRLTGEAVLELDSRHQLNLIADITRIHEDRGSNDALTGAEPSIYNDHLIGATYLFGAQGAQGNLEVTASYLDHRYANFANLNASRERNNLRLGSTFFYGIAPKTRALIEVRHERIDYHQAGSTLDNDEQKALLGVTWDATAKTSGSAKLGTTRKTYDSSVHNDQSSASWEVSARWAPQTYSSVDLETSQEFEEASGDEAAIDTTHISLAWTHRWSESLSTNAVFSHLNEDYLGQTTVSRLDKTDSRTLNIDYKLHRWLSLAMGLTHADTDSNTADESHTNNTVMITLSASL